MKRIAKTLLCIFILLMTVSCMAAKNETLSPSSPPTEGGVEVIEDKKELQKLYDQYLHPVFIAGITAQNWDIPTDIRPDCFIEFYVAKEMPIDRELEQEDSISATELENYVQKYFDVPVDHLQKSKYYDASAQKYTLGYLGGAAFADVIAATRSDNAISLQFEYYSPADEKTVIREGILLISQNGDEYKYISCKSSAIEPSSAS